MKKGQSVKIRKMTKQEFKKTVKIHKVKTLKNGFISITYSYVLGNDTVSTQTTIEAYKNGNDLNSLYIYQHS